MRRVWRVGLVAFIVASLAAPAMLSTPAFAADGDPIKAPQSSTGGSQCGSGQNAVKTSINIGCRGASCTSSNAHGCSALLDATFAIIRFLSAGVGLVVIGSVVYAGIQYMSARDDPSAVGKAKARIVSSLTALLIFVFSYAILNYVIPAGFFK